MSSVKEKPGRSSVLKNDSSGIRKIHSRHTWVKSYFDFVRIYEGDFCFL